jgi:hypothetical protein
MALERKYLCLWTYKFSFVCILTFGIGYSAFKVPFHSRNEYGEFLRVVAILDLSCITVLTLSRCFF